MGEYREFKRCVICRTRQNLKNYFGYFEETMLLNSLYMAVMFPLETRQRNHAVKSGTIVRYLREHNIVDDHGNDFDTDTIIRCLRNALAHYNLQVESSGNQISRIKLWSINRPYKTLCKTEDACKEPRCYPMQYKTDDEGAICTFELTMKQLRDFTDMVMDHAMERMAEDKCNGCPYEERKNT